MGTPPVDRQIDGWMEGQTRVKTLSSRRITYAGGKNSPNTADYTTKTFEILKKLRDLKLQPTDHQSTTITIPNMWGRDKKALNSLRFCCKTVLWNIKAQLNLRFKIEIKKIIWKLFRTLVSTHLCYNCVGDIWNIRSQIELRWSAGFTFIWLLSATDAKCLFNGSDESRHYNNVNKGIYKTIKWRSPLWLCLVIIVGWRVHQV